MADNQWEVAGPATPIQSQAAPAQPQTNAGDIPQPVSSGLTDQPLPDYLKVHLPGGGTRPFTSDELRPSEWQVAGPSTPVQAEQGQPTERQSLLMTAAKAAIKTSPLAILGLPKQLSEYYGRKGGSSVSLLDPTAGAATLLKDAIKDPEHPLNQLVSNIWQSHVQQAQKAKAKADSAVAAAKRGDYWEAGAALSEMTGHELATVVPVLGPMAAQAAETYGQGAQTVKAGQAIGSENITEEGKQQLAQGGGEMVGLAGSMAAPAAAEKVLPKVGEAAKAVKNVVTKPGEIIGRVGEARAASKATGQAVEATPAAEVTGKGAEASAERIYQKHGKAAGNAEKVALGKPDYKLDMKEGSPTHTKLQALYDRLQEDIRSGKVTPQATDSVVKTLNDLLVKKPTEADFVTADPETGVETVDHDGYHKALEKYEAQAERNGKDVTADLNNLRKATDADQAAMRRNEPGKADAFRYHVEAKKIFKDAAADAAGNEGQLWKAADKQYQQTLQRQGRSQYKGAKAGPAARLMQPESEAATPEQQIKGLNSPKVDRTTMREYLKDRTPEEVENIQKGAYKDLRSSNKTAQGALNRFEKNAEANQELYGDKYDTYHKALKYDAAKEAMKKIPESVPWIGPVLKAHRTALQSVGNILGSEE